MILRFLILFVLCLSTLGTDYFVRTDGNDGNTGTSNTAGGAWLTIQHAATTMVAGDSVSVAAGTYNEYVACANSGTAGSPITYQATGANFTTIIDPSTAFGSGWVAAGEIGTGVYKQTGMSWECREMTIDNKRVPFASAIGDMSGDIGTIYDGSSMSTGADLLTMLSAHTETLYDGQTVTPWDTLGALYCANGTTCYLRFRDGRNPNGEAIRMARNLDGSRSMDVTYPAVMIENINYTIWRGFKIQGAFCGFDIKGTSHGNIIQSNYIQNGCERVYLVNGPAQNTVANNEMTCNYYGYTDIGAWESYDAGHANREHVYLWSKYPMGGGGSFSTDVYMYNIGASNIIASNHVFKAMGPEVVIFGDIEAPATKNQIYANTLEQGSSIGVTLSYGTTDTYVYDNLISDCNIGIRFEEMDTADETDRVHYVYRNRFWMPAYTGNNLFFHFNGTPNPASYFPTIWIYNNSFSGGRYGVGLGLNRSIQNSHYVNNICSGSYWFDSYGVLSAGFNPQYDYNYLAGSYDSGAPAWYGAHNIANASIQWATNTVTTFALPAGSQAINAAYDLPTNQPTLPQDGTVKVGANWDIGALEYSSGGTTTNRTVLRNLRINNAVIR